jgi:DNA polymerase
MDHAAMKEYCLQDVNLESALLQRLLPLIDNPKFELDLARHTLNLYLKPVLDLDLCQAEKFEVEMLVEADAAIERVKIYWPPDTKTVEIRKILRGRKEFPLILQRWLKDDVLPEKLGKAGMIPALAKNDEACQQLLCHPNKAVRDLVQARLDITSWPSHAKRVQSIINQARCSDGKVRVPLKYYGGHTGRWSGTEGVNLQNLGGKGRGKPIHPLIGAVRGCLVAPKNHTLAIVDSAQIEARALAWLAGQDDLVKGFADGKDIYSEFASKLFDCRVWKPASDDDSPDAKIAGIRRGFGKDAILGCGYGMGTNKFYSRCRENDSLRPLFDSGQYDWDFIDRLIKTYRTTYYKIPDFWSTIEKCFRFPIKYPNETTEYRLNNRVMLKFEMQKSTLIMTLPSGRRMFYRHAHLDSKGTIKDHYSAWWGGSITENTIQSLCRDLLGYWLLECEKQRIHIVHHSHDESVGCVPETVAERQLKDIIAIMSTGPDWAKGLPLAAEGSLSQCYKK